MSAISPTEVLVIEPDTAISTLIEAVLRRQGVRIDAVRDRGSAIRKAAERQYSAVVVEPRIPGGAQLVAELDAMLRERTMIVLTTPALSNVRYSELKAVRAVLIKPFRINELCDEVRACCGPGHSELM